MRITNVRNRLPFSVVTAPSVNSFKNRLDINTGHYKNLNMIGKQNYQEPGVEAELNFEFFESFHFYRAMHFSAKRGIAIACRLSVRPSVCLSVCL